MQARFIANRPERKRWRLETTKNMTYQKPVSVPDISFKLTYRIFSKLGHKLFYLAKHHFILG